MTRFITPPIPGADEKQAARALAGLLRRLVPISTDDGLRNGDGELLGRINRELAALERRGASAVTTLPAVMSILDSEGHGAWAACVVRHC